MKWNTPVTRPAKKHFFFFVFFFLFLFVNASAQSKSRANHYWNHPVIMAMERHDPAVVAFMRPPNLLVNLCIVDTVKGMAWYVSQHGFIFDSLRLTTDRKKQIRTVSKQANPFRWFEDSIGQYFFIIEDAKEFLRQNGSNFKKASSVQQWLFSQPSIKEAPTTLAKLLDIEEYERTYKSHLMNFNWRMSSFQDTSVQNRLREGLKPGSLVIHGTLDSGYSEFINKEQLTAIRKASLDHATGEIRLYDWKNKAVDSFFINKKKVTVLVNEKTDVFVLYHAWLEWNLQQLNAAIPAWQYAANYELLKNKGHFLYADFANQKSSRATLTGLQQQKKKVLKKINALSGIDATLFATIFAIPTYERIKETRRWNGQSWVVTISPIYRDNYTYTRGHKRYELTDHRGNVIATVSDKKKGIDINNDGTVDVYEADVTTATDYYPFGSQMPERKYSKDKPYRYGSNGKENDNEVKGEGNQQDYGMRIYDPRVGRFLSVDPLTKNYSMLTPYQFASNRPIDGIDLDGLEYVSIHHYANGVTGTTMHYKHSDEIIKKIGGTTKGRYNSASYGPLGKGVVHYLYSADGKLTKTYWEQRQGGFEADLTYHGLYSGPGSVTKDGLPGSKNWNFDLQPIDWADAIAKRHDKDYVDYTKDGEENYGYLEDTRTVQADRDMVKRIDNLIWDATNPLVRKMKVEGVKTPFRTSVSGEMLGTATGQRALINALATYKEWKISKGFTKNIKEQTYDVLRNQFAKDHPLTAIILDKLPKKEEKPEGSSSADSNSTNN